MKQALNVICAIFSTTNAMDFIVSFSKFDCT